MSKDGETKISETSKTVAKNTIALYFRMLILLFVGLFTSRIILNALGVEDRGVYETVGSFVSMMAIITSSLSTAISRFVTVEIGKNDKDKLRSVFSTARVIMVAVAILVLLIAEPLGVYYIDHIMKMPPGRLVAAHWVFQFSLLTFVINLLSVPYNATIIAHEKMSAFAIIGVFEGVCKLIVALLVMYSSFDKLISYSLLMCAVALMVRFLYAFYCARHFEESRAGFSFNRDYLRSMLGFAGWNGLAYGVFLVNTQGTTQLLNYFFGVIFNTMRGIASNVENMVKQFVTNVIMAINPQITKSLSAGNKEYAFELTCKGSKYAFLIILFLSMPFFFEAETILRLWLGNIVPEGTALFTRLTLICLLLDIIMTTLATLIQATGKIRTFYLVTTGITALIFPVTWILFKAGAPASVLYVVFIADYFIADVVKLFLIKKQMGFPIGLFMREVIFKVIPVALIGFAVATAFWLIVPQGIWRLLVVVCAGSLAICTSAYFFALTPGEKNFVDDKIRGVLKKSKSL